MGSTIDDKFSSLRAMGHTGAMSDMLLQWLHSNGATSNNINDAWREALIANGFDGDIYQWNDAWYKVLGDLGYTGALNDRESAFWAAGGNVGNWRFVFNGVDQYATMAGWAAEGKPRTYAVNFVANAVSTGTEQHILSGTEGGIDLNIYLHATLPVLSIQYRDDVGGQAIEGVLDAADEIVAGVTYTLEIINLGTGPTILLNGKDVDITAFSASDGIQPALTHMGAKHDNTSFFGGSIWSTHLSDGSPIHDTYANMGDGNRYGELEQAIVLEGDLDISVDWIRQEFSGTGSLWLIGSVDGGNSGIRVYDSASVAPDDVRVNYSGNTATFTGALAGVAIGQHISIRVERRGVETELFIDEGSLGKNTSAAVFPMVIEYLFSRSDSIAPLPAGSTLQNLKIKDLENNYTFNYPLDEGPTTDTGPELIEGDPTLTGSLSTWDGTTMHLEGLNPTGTFQGTEVVSGTDYHVTFDYNTSAANTYIRLGGGGNVALISGPAVGTYDETLTAGGTGYIMQLLSDGIGDFTNFSVKAAAGGNLIHNIDPSTPGYNGAWTPDTDWQFIDDNSRFYPMGGGPDDGATLVCRDGNNDPTPVNDATIQNYDPSGWEQQ